MGVSNHLKFRASLPSLPGSTSLYTFGIPQGRPDRFGQQKICFSCLGLNSDPSVTTPLPHLTAVYGTEIYFVG